jgi:hypothetical protein
MSNEVDRYGRFVEPAEAHQQFMLALYDLEDDPREAGYSNEATARLHEARLFFGRVRSQVSWLREGARSLEVRASASMQNFTSRRPFRANAD